MNVWECVYKSSNYYYWKHRDGYYNVTTIDLPPITEAGYNSLVVLAKKKCEAYQTINEMRTLEQSICLVCGK